MLRIPNDVCKITQSSQATEYLQQMKKEVRKAMEKAKELEKTPLPTREEIVKTYKDGLKEAEKLRKLLKPQWFVKETHTLPTRKKKTL